MRSATDNVIRLHFGADRVEEIPAPTFEELAIEDFLRMTAEPEHPETELDIFVRFFGVRREVAQFISIAEMEKILEVYLGYIRQSRDSFERIRAISAELDDREANGVAWTAADARELIERIRAIPEKLLVEGEEFVVPRSVDAATVYGQYRDVRLAVAAHKGDEVSLYPRLLAILCRKEGEAYDPSVNPERERTMAAVPIVDALTVCAFFFSTSERLRETLNQRFPFCLAWRKPSPRLTSPTSTPVGETSAN